MACGCGGQRSTVVQTPEDALTAEQIRRANDGARVEQDARSQEAALKNARQ